MQGNFTGMTMWGMCNINFGPFRRLNIVNRAVVWLRVLVQRKQVCLRWSPKYVIAERRITEIVRQGSEFQAVRAVVWHAVLG